MQRDPAGEEELVRGLRAGDEAAFEELVRRYGPPLLAAGRRILRCEEEARDALQDGLIAAHRAIGSFQGQARLSTWLHRIVVNCCLMRLRSRKRRPEEPIESLLPRFDAEGHPSEPFLPWRDVESEVARRQVSALVRAAIDRLPEKHRTVLLLRDIEELDTAEAAALLGVSENAVKIRLHRARQALRGLIDPDLRRIST